MIGKSISRTASIQITDPTATGYIADGEIVALNSTGGILTAGNTISDSPTIRIAARSGNNILLSNVINGNRVLAFKGIDGSAGQEQIYHIGYNGSTGTGLDVTTGTDFYVNVTYKHDIEFWAEQQKKRVYFSSQVAPTQLKVARDIVKQAVDDPGAEHRTEMLNSGSAATIGSVTLAVTNGSKTITYSGTPTGVSAGSLLRIGATGSGIGTGIAVYEADSVSTNTVTLKIPYQGPSNSALPNADHGLIASPGSAYGIRLTGMNLNYRLDFFKLMRVQFNVGMSGLGDTVLYKTQEMSIGQGDGRKVAEVESFALGFEGALNRKSVPLPLGRADAVKTTSEAINTTYGNTFVSATTNYDCIALKFFGQATATATAPVRSEQEIRLYLVDGASQSTNLLAQLNPWMASTPQAFAAITL